MVLATITVAIGCGYFLTGKFINTNYYETIANINKQPNIKVSIVNYNRGFFTSNADLTVELGADNPSDAQVITLKQVITHGPIIFANTQNGHRIKFLAAQINTTFGEPWSKKLEEFTSSKHALTITTLVKFSNQASTWFRLTNVDQTTPTQFHVAWDAIQGIIEHDFNFAYYHGYITLPKLEVENPEWQFKLKNLVLNIDSNDKDAAYTSSNTLSTENITYTKAAKEVIRLEGISAKLAFINKENNLALDLEAMVRESQIVDQHFKDDKITLQANNLNRETLAHFPRITTIGAKGTADLLQELTVASTAVNLQLPKHFTEAIISYLSYELYRGSYLGKFDQRPEPAILQDITGSIHKLVQGAVQQQLFLDKGAYYSLNFDRPLQS